MRDQVVVSQNEQDKQSDKELAGIIEVWMVFLTWAAKEWLPTVKEDGKKRNSEIGTEQNLMSDLQRRF